MDPDQTMSSEKSAARQLRGDRSQTDDGSHGIFDVNRIFRVAAALLVLVTALRFLGLLNQVRKNGVRADLEYLIEILFRQQERGVPDEGPLENIL